MPTGDVYPDTGKVYIDTTAIQNKIIEEYFDLLRKSILAAFDNKELVLNWERLRKTKLKTEKSMKLFCKDMKNVVFERLSDEAVKELKHDLSTRK